MSARLLDDSRLRRWVLAQLDGATAIVAERRLVGGLTSDMRHLRVEGGVHRDVVLRRWAGRGEWQTRAWQELCVRREAVALTSLAGSPVAAPELIASDVDGSDAGHPVSLMTFVAGEPNLSPASPHDWLRQLARVLATIHALPPPDLPSCDTVEVSEERDWSWLGDAGLAREALAAARSAGPNDQKVFSHGDFQHFNLLWQRGQLRHVVDWTGTGPAWRGLDVGHCRVNLAVLFTSEIAMEFLDLYETAAGILVHPATDVRELLAFSPHWPEFIPVQVAGRARVDPDGMAARVRETVRLTLERSG